MRAIAPFVAGIVLTACGAGAGDPPLGTPSNELTLPAQLASSQGVIVYAELDGDHATSLNELDYGLAEAFPAQVTLSAESGYVLGKTCPFHLGAVLWKSIAEVQGTAAKVSLVDGALAIDLREEGEVSALLEGEITDQQCTPGDGPALTSIPLQHRIVLHVHRVAGYEVEQWHQQLADCRDTVVLPSGAPLWTPTASPLDGAGQRFEAANAPAPVAITLRSEGNLTPGDAGKLSATAGTVSISLDTKLPVRGLASFDVVDADALTSVEAALHLRKAAAKGSVSEPIEAGNSYAIFYPEQSNDVGIQVESAMTAGGKLCANVPGTWFSATSSTPEQCAASAAGADDDHGNFTSVAAVRSPGECRLEVTIPGTSHRWTTKFSTTF